TLLSCRVPVVSDIIWSVRSQRSRAVQNEEQYFYIHYLTVQRLVNKGIVADKVVSKFCRDYEHFYFTRTNRMQIPLPIFDKKKLPPKKMIEAESITPSSLTSSTVTPTSTTSDSRQLKKKKGLRKKKTRTPTQQTGLASQAKISRSQPNLQQEYYEAQNALLESYRKAQMNLLKTFTHKQQQQKTKNDKLSTKTSIMQTMQKEEELNVEVSDTKVAKIPEEPKVPESEITVKSEDDKTGSKSQYAFLTDEVRKIKQMEESRIMKEDEIDRADYVFMQPVYANTYGASETDTRDVAEKYVMNMLPEQYFDQTMDDGAEYVTGTPQIRIKDNLENAKKL
ncbi:unnamed protein product, partial [Onchocerca ochengi]